MASFFDVYCTEGNWVGYDLMMWRLVFVCAQNGNTALSIARRLGYISVVDTLKVVTEETLTTMVRLHAIRTDTQRFSFQMSEMSTSMKRRDSFASLLHITYSKQFRCMAKYSTQTSLYTDVFGSLGFELIITELTTTLQLHLSLKKIHRNWKEATALFVDGDREAQDKRSRNNERGSGYVWWWR